MVSLRTVAACATPCRVALARTLGARQWVAQGRAMSASPRGRPAPQQALQRGEAGRAYAGFAGHDKTFRNATTAEVSDLLLGGAKYLDVRTPEEFKAGHVPGAANVPVWMPGGGGMQPNPDFMKEVEQLYMDKGDSLVVGCKSGRRSEAACEMMTKAGFSGLTNMLGGFDAWASENRPVEK